MGTTTGRQIADDLAVILEDVNFVTYTEEDLLRAIIDAFRAVCLVRPDAYVVTETFKLESNRALQALPDGITRLGGILQNMGADGATYGKAITGPVPREKLDAVAPDWMTTAGAYVRQFTYDEATPRQFFVQPPVAGEWYVLLKVFRVPPPLAALDDAIPLDDIYVPAIREWALYHEFARDSERTPNYTRAGRHFTNFFQMLGVKVRSDMAVSPKVLEQDRQLTAGR